MGQVNSTANLDPFLTQANSGWATLFILGLISFGWSIARVLAKRPGASLFNPKKWTEISSSRAIREVLFNMREVLDAWFAENPGRPIRLLSDIGEMTVIAPELAEAIRSDPKLSFVRANNPPFHPHIAGFEAFGEGAKHEGKLIKTVLNKDLSKLLNKVTWPLAEEALLAFPEYFGTEKSWRKVPLRDTLLPLVARLSTRVFMGEELCRNKEWLKISSEYSSDSFMAADKLRQWPKFLRPLVSHFAPYGRSLRKQVDDARRIIEPLLQQRQKLKAETKAKGGTLKFNDSLEWFERNASASYDPVAMQLFLSLVAIHSTTDLISQFMVDVARNPEIIAPLKEEILGVLGTEGWTKSALFKMKLLDSALKETQRLKPIQLASMLRASAEDFTLPDGTFVPRDHVISVSTHAMRDPAVYRDPEVWDGYRFFRMREQPGKELSAQLVTTSSEHLGFGHGSHACPGRFFAANEVKIAMVFILLQYDWRLLPGAKPQTVSWGVNWNTDPTIEIEVRRTNCIDIDPKAGVLFV
ncbi:cytochrome P450 monooxygenase [Corynespora cassiicola Philippines]|uniref:Cytochrome P450 monooxygenase n=1 Tax=Corynespora cassiicola Philippines TaxID=1448308 RepID=A0A2T2N872_CORCC|nr:cytochrome P450 monooxygenase [Corynespora cassiicola Philippines]